MTYLIIGSIMVIISTFIALSTIIGFIKFNNVYTQIHIGTIYDMVGLPLMMVGIGFLFLARNENSIAIKFFLATVLWYVVSPISSYIMIKISYFYNKNSQQQH